MNNIKLLILGHQRHGKDTLAEILRDNLGISFISSSQACADIFIYDELKNKYGYKTSEECFLDRVNHRAKWYQMICDYNKDDKARLAKEILKYNNTYVGMRDRAEIQECRRIGLFDLIIWVDASERLPLEDASSFNITKDDADIIIENNGTPEELKVKGLRLGKFLNITKESDDIIQYDKFLSGRLNVIGILRDYDFIDEDDTLDPYSLIQATINWPTVDNEGEQEDLDMENWEILELSPDKMVVCGGGDWQDPLTFTLIADGNRLKATDIKAGYENGMNNDNIRKILKTFGSIV